MTEIDGRLETIAGRIVDGWAVDPADPERPLTVEIRDGDRLLGSTIAAGAGAGVPGAARRRFSFLLPLDIFDGQEHVISARIGDGPELQNSPLRVVGHDPTPDLGVRPALAIPSGSLDLVSDEGWVMGWAWYPNSPAERVEIEFLIDGELSGSTLAASYRADVAAAGVGDGNYGFSWALPYHVLTRSRDSLVTARDKRTGHVLPEPRRFRQMVVIDAVEKVTALETDLRQLHAALAVRTGRERADQREAAELFRIVGDFFVQLAAATAAGEPPGAVKTLRNAVSEVTTKYRPFAFDLPAAPEITICVGAAAPLPRTYRQLRALRDQIGGGVEVILIDAGGFEDTALLPLVVRNLRYLRLDRGPVGNCNDAFAAATGRLVVFCGTPAAPAEGWLEAVAAGFAEAPGHAALAAKLLGADGVLDHAGVSLADGAPVLLGQRRDPDAEDFCAPCQVDAVAGEVFAMRRASWAALRGLDESYTGLDAALADACLRLSNAGATIRYEPGFCLTRLADAANAAAPDRDDTERLRRAADLQPATA